MAGVDLALLVAEASDRVLFPTVARALETFLAEHRRMPQMSQVNGVWQRALAIGRADQLFEKVAGERFPGSYEVWLQGRRDLADRRGDRHTHELAFFEMLHALFFGKPTSGGEPPKPDHAIPRRLAAELLREHRKDAGREERQRLQVALFKELVKHIYLRAGMQSRTGRPRTQRRR